MGATFQASTSIYVKACKLDADCYPASAANPVFAAATTDAEKKVRCCLSMGYVGYPLFFSGVGVDGSA